MLTAGEVKAASKEDLTVALLHKWLTGDDGAPAQDDLHDYLESVYGINKKGDKNWTALKLKISGDAPKATPMESLLSLMTKAIEAKSGGGAAPAASATGSPYIKTVKLVDKRAMSQSRYSKPNALGKDLLDDLHEAAKIPAEGFGDLQDLLQKHWHPGKVKQSLAQGQDYMLVYEHGSDTIAIEDIAGLANFVECLSLWQAGPTLQIVDYE